MPTPLIYIAVLRWLSLFYHALRGWWRRQQACNAHWRKGAKPVKHAKSKPKPRSGGRRKPAWVVAEILQAWDQGCKSFRQIANEFNRRHGHMGISVCHNTVYDWVQKCRTEMLAVQKATKNRVPHHVDGNVRWCVDATGRDDDSKQRHFIFGIVDHGTRLCIQLKRMTEHDSAALLREILVSTEVYGKPKSIRTDCASVFMSEEFKAGLKAAGIRHDPSEPGKPWQNGRIERFFWTLKDKLKPLTALPDGDTLDGLLTEFRFWYNRIRPHQHLCGWTPAEAWEGVNPYLSKPKAILSFSAWGGLLLGEFLQR